MSAGKSAEEAADELIARVAGLDPAPRDREVAAYARRLAINGEGRAAITALVAALEQRGSYERWLAALMAWAGEDGKWIAAHLGYDDRAVRRSALSAARSRPDLINDSALESALNDASHAARFEIYPLIRGRPELADRLMDTVRRDWGDGEAVLLLPACSQEAVARLLPDLLYAVRGWGALVKNHAAAVVDVLSDDYARGTVQADTWWAKNGAPVGLLLQAGQLANGNKEDFFFSCIEDTSRPPSFLTGNKYNPFGSAPTKQCPALNTLARSNPGRFLRALATAPGAKPLYNCLNKRTVRLFAHSALPELHDYVRVMPQFVASFMRYQAPSARPATFEAAGWTGMPSGFMMSLLPASYAATVARRVPKAKAAKGLSWKEEIELQVYLPHAEVGARLLAATRKASADDRKAGWSAYVKNVARTRDRALLEATLELMVDRLRNEQCPVRMSAIEKLVGVPTSVWTPAAAASCLRLITNDTEANDHMPLSYAVQALAAKFLRDSKLAEYGMAIYRTELSASRDLNFNSSPRLSLERLPLSAASKIYTAVEGILDMDAESGDTKALLRLAAAFGKHAEHIPGLQARLRDVIEQSKDDDSVRTAVDLWLQPVATRTERVAQVFALDASTAALPRVAAVIAGHLTSLVPQAVSAAGGRFTASPDWFFETDTRCARRWTPAQSRAYLAHLGRPLNDTRPTQNRKRALRAASIVPAGVDVIRTFVNDSEVPLSEAALRALGRYPGELGLLLSYASSDRARVAIFAASSCAKSTRPSKLAPQLRAAISDPKAKVTSRKEIVRMLTAYLPNRVAAAELLALWGDAETHKDVRAAMVRAAIGLLDTPEAWEIVTSAAALEDEDVRCAVVKDVDAVPQAHRTRYSELMSSLAQTDDDVVAACALLHLGSWGAYIPAAGEIAAAVVADLSRKPEVWHEASAAVSSLAVSPAHRPALLDLVTQLLATPEPESTTEDVPVHRRIEYLATLVRALPDNEGGQLKREMAEVLAQKDSTVPFAVRLLEYSLTATPSAEALQKIADLCNGRPVLANEAASSSRIWGMSVDPTPQWLSAIADVAASSTAGGLIVAGMAAVSSSTRWDKWQPLVHKLRRHPDADVRMKAMAIVAPV